MMFHFCIFRLRSIFVHAPSKSFSPFRKLSLNALMLKTLRKPCRLFLCGVFCGLLSTNLFGQESGGLLETLPASDEALMREQLERHTVRLDSTRGDAGIPANIYYQMLLRELLVDIDLRARLSGHELAFLDTLAAPWDQRFVREDRAQLESLCADLAASAGENEEMIVFALRFDAARNGREHQLDVYYADALARLEPTTRAWTQSLLDDLLATRHVAYAVFDLSGFAAALPQAAGEILERGCENFRENLSQPLREAYLGDPEQTPLLPLH